MKYLLMLLIVFSFCGNLYAQEETEIKDSMYCGMVYYLNLKDQLVSGKIDPKEEVELLDWLGALLGRANELVKKKYGSRSGKYEVYRAGAVSKLNEHLLYLSKASNDERLAHWKVVGEKCGALYARTMYTDEDYKRGKAGYKELQKTLNEMDVQ